MKKHLYYIMLPILLFTSCDKSAHHEEEGIVISLTNTTDLIEDITIWAFGSDNLLKYHYDFSTAQEMALTPLKLAVDKYTIVASTNLTHGFSHNTEIGISLENLLISIDDASSSPQHVHFGTATATMNKESITSAKIGLSRTLAELQLTIRDVPSEVVSAQLRVLNSTKAYYPGTSILASDREVVDYGEEIPNENMLLFNNKRIMPVIATPTRGDDKVTTHIELLFKYNNGGEISFELEAPAIQNGGVYSPEIPYSILRPGNIILINEINGWIGMTPIEGEILNPNESK